MVSHCIVLGLFCEVVFVFIQAVGFLDICVFHWTATIHSTKKTANMSDLNSFQCGVI